MRTSEGEFFGWLFAVLSWWLSSKLCPFLLGGAEEHCVPQQLFLVLLFPADIAQAWFSWLLPVCCRRQEGEGRRSQP